MEVEFLDRKIIRYDEVEKYLLESEKQNHFTNDGPVKKKLEQYLEAKLNINADKRVLCCGNGTVALHAIMLHVTEKFGGCHWATPAFTFPSVVVGNPFFNVDMFDIDPATHTLPMDAKLLELSDAIVLTNLFGSYVDMEAWEEFCRKHDKILIFDNAASPLSTSNGHNICNFGNYSFGSLHHTKYLGFGEGGFIVCPEDEYEDLYAVTNFGFYGNRDYKELSSNFKMSDVAAAFILQHINNYDVAEHVQVQQKLLDGIKDFDVEPLNYKDGVIYNTFPVVFKKPIDEEFLKYINIRAHKYYKPLVDVPNSNDLYDRIVNFPLHSRLSDDDISLIINSIRCMA